MGQALFYHRNRKYPFVTFLVALEEQMQRMKLIMNLALLRKNLVFCIHTSAMRIFIDKNRIMY